jgi:hypothetical protein
MKKRSSIACLFHYNVLGSFDAFDILHRLDGCLLVVCIGYKQSSIHRSTVKKYNGERSSFSTIKQIRSSFLLNKYKYLKNEILLVSISSTAIDRVDSPLQADQRRSSCPTLNRLLADCPSSVTVPCSSLDALKLAPLLLFPLIS